jgi:hypothetical protein
MYNIRCLHSGKYSKSEGRPTQTSSWLRNLLLRIRSSEKPHITRIRQPGSHNQDLALDPRLCVPVFQQVCLFVFCYIKMSIKARINPRVTITWCFIILIRITVYHKRLPDSNIESRIYTDICAHKSKIAR